MNRQRIGFVAIAVSVASGLLLAGLATAQDEKKHVDVQTSLGKIMAKVQKINKDITGYTRNAAAYKKNQKELEKASGELLKLAKESKPIKQDYLKNAKNESDPSKKWDELMDEWVKRTKALADAAAKTTTTQKQAKDLFQSMRKTCGDCHTVFNLEQEF